MARLALAAVVAALTLGVVCAGATSARAGSRADPCPREHDLCAATDCSTALQCAAACATPTCIVQCASKAESPEGRRALQDYQRCAASVASQALSSPAPSAGAAAAASAPLNQEAEGGNVSVPDLAAPQQGLQVQDAEAVVEGLRKVSAAVHAAHALVDATRRAPQRPSAAVVLEDNDTAGDQTGDADADAADLLEGEQQEQGYTSSDAARDSLDAASPRFRGKFIGSALKAVASGAPSVSSNAASKVASAASSVVSSNAASKVASAVSSVSSNAASKVASAASSLVSSNAASKVGSIVGNVAASALRGGSMGGALAGSLLGALSGGGGGGGGGGNAPPTQSDVEACVACWFVWERVAMQLGKSPSMDNVVQAFEATCQDSPDVFYTGCDDMFDREEGMVQMFLQGARGSALCTAANIC